MDLADLDTRSGGEAGFPVVLVHPKNGQQLGATITVRGADSPTYQAAMVDQQRRRLDALARNRRAAQQNVEQAALDALELLAAVTVGWEGITRNGVPVPFSQPEAVKLYRDFPWIAEQVEAAIYDRGNFLPQSAKS